MNTAPSQSGKFWIRLAAFWTDGLIIWGLTEFVSFAFRLIHIYIPFELVFVLFFLLYSVISISASGHTVGKYCWGLKVVSTSDGSLGLFRVILREWIGKCFSIMTLFLGFLWIAIGSSKKGFHDYLAGTVVRKATYYPGKYYYLLSLIIVFTTAIPLRHGINKLITVYCATYRMSCSSATTLPARSTPSKLVDISSLKEKDYVALGKWIEKNGKEPVEYLVRVASQHQVTILGEIHEQRDYLMLLNHVIPDLYYRAGVTCIAMEVCLAEDNERINRLVTGEKFDEELALELARHQSWGIWGFKEYWDVFRTVWNLNRQIPATGKKMRLIGIDAKFDGPSMALVTGGEGAKIKSPIWEKLRILRLFVDILLTMRRDEIMADNIVREIIEKKERGVVWIGLQHSYMNYQQPIVVNGKLVRKWNRMGMLLHQKYGNQIFQVALHEPYLDSIMVKVLEPLMKKRGNVPAGFTVQGSPFASLRDKSSDDYRFQPQARFADRACGYIFLKPRADLKKCTWLPNYVSTEMFIANKPFYEGWCNVMGKEARNAKEANEALSIIMQSN